MVEENQSNKSVRDTLKVIADAGGYPVYGGNGIMGYTNRFSFPEGTVVGGLVGAYCGNVHMTAADAWVADNAVVVKEVADMMHPAFLMHILQP